VGAQVFPVDEQTIQRKMIQRKTKTRRLKAHVQVFPVDEQTIQKKMTRPKETEKTGNTIQDQEHRRRHPRRQISRRLHHQGLPSPRRRRLGFPDRLQAAQEVEVSGTEGRRVPLQRGTGDGVVEPLRRISLRMSRTLFLISLQH
jgi:hypothetical protein